MIPDSLTLIKLKKLELTYILKYFYMFIRVNLYIALIIEFFQAL